MKKKILWSPFSNPSNSLRLNRIKRRAHSLKLINSYEDSCAVAAVFNTLHADIIHDLGWKNSIWHLEFAAAENKGLLGRACFNVPSPLCVPAWAPWTCWCSRTDISYHRLMLPRRRSPPETSGTDCPFPCPRRNCCRCYSLERNNELSYTNCLGLCSLLSGIIVDARNVCDSVSLCVFLLGSGPEQTVHLLPEAPQPHFCQHPPKMSFIQEALFKDITHMAGFSLDMNGFQYSHSSANQS